MHEMIKRRKDEGFTLIELMIVIAVIGILAVVLMPKMAGIKTTARTTGVMTNTKSVQAYLTANYDRWVNDSGSTNATIAAEINTNFSLDNALKNPYTGGVAVSSNIPYSGSSTDYAPTDALQIFDVMAGAPATYEHGTIAITVPATFRTSGIQVTGYDDTGKIFVPTVNVKL